MKAETRQKIQQVGRKIGPVRIAISSLIFLGVAVVWGLFLRGTFQAMQIGSGSMEPTIAVGDRVIVWYREGFELERGMVVIVKSPDDNGPDLIKRLVALPGDTISYRESYFHLNGVHSPPPGRPVRQISARAHSEYRLKADEYFVLGDNRGSSHDSSEFGPVSRDHIKGTVLFRYAPRGRMGRVE